MTIFLFALTASLVILQFSLPRRWAFLPLIIAALHTNYGVQVIPSFTIARLIIVAGVFRAFATNQIKWSARNPLDLLMLGWAFIALISTIGHEPTASDATPFIARARMVVDACGTFLYAKAYIRNIDDFKRLSKAIAIAIIPLALSMTYSKLTGGINAHWLVGGQRYPVQRNGTLRAIGPFASPILAGTIGALFLPMVLIIWREHKKTAKIGLACCLLIIFSAGSSTPIGAMLILVSALLLWRFRAHLKVIVVTSVVVLILMDLVKNRPIWYLIALTDFVGGSTGYHRAKLIDQAIRYFDEWWLFGTDYTRHWMPYGLTPEHSDMTNYYIHLGVLCGFPLTLILIGIFWKSFSFINQELHSLRTAGDRDEFLLWAIGSLLFTHALTCLTISYFDQTYILFYFLIAFISNLRK